MVLNFSDKDFAHLLDVTLKELAKKIETLPYDLDIAWTAYGNTLSAVFHLSQLVALMNYAGFLTVMYIDSKMWQRNAGRKLCDEQNFGMILHYVNSCAIDRTFEKRRYMFQNAYDNSHKYSKLNEAESCFVKSADEISLFNRLHLALAEIAQLLKLIYYEESGKDNEGGSISCILPTDIAINKFDASLEASVEQSVNIIINLKKTIDTMKRKFPTRALLESVMIWYACELEFTIDSIHQGVIDFAYTGDLDFELANNKYDMLTDDVMKEYDDCTNFLIDERKNFLDNKDLLKAELNSPFNINYDFGNLHIITKPFTQSAGPVLESCMRLAHDFRDYLEGGYNKMFNEVREEGLL